MGCGVPFFLEDFEEAFDVPARRGVNLRLKGKKRREEREGTYRMRLSWMMVFHAARSLWKCAGEKAS